MIRSSYTNNQPKQAQPKEEEETSDRAYSFIRQKKTPQLKTKMPILL